MKKIIIFLISFLLVLAFANAECLIPHGLAGTVRMEGVSPDSISFTILIENLNYGGTLTTSTNNQGYFQQDLGNLPNCYSTGNDIKISIQGCSLSACSQVIKVSGGRNIVNFNLPLGAVEIKYTCWDDSIVNNVADCPVQPTTIVEKEIETTKLTDIEAKITSYYGQSINVVLGDNKLASLQDKEIEFNDKDYNIKEEMTIKGKVLTSLDDEDLGDKPYLTLKEGDIIYKYIFEDAIPKNEVTEDEPLNINLLGQDRKIVDLKDTEFTMMSGTKVIILEGETVNGIKLDTVGSDYAYIIYNGEGKKINEGKTEKIGDVQFYVEEVIENNDKVSKAFITYGKEVKKIIKDGDDYNDEEVFKWIVTSNSIGIINQQEYKDIDVDSDYKALAIGESICLPNNFICVKFGEITNQKVSELKIKVKDSALYVTSADSELSFGTEEYDRIYVKSDGFYDKDQVIITHTGKIKIADGDNYLELGSLKIGLLTIPLDMNDILYNGISFAGRDYTTLDYFGFIFTEPKQAIEDKSGFIVKVPEERPEAIVLVSSEVVVEQPEVVPETTTPTTIPETTKPVTSEIIPEKPIINPEPIVIEKIICADGTEVTDKSLCVETKEINWLLDTFLAIIGLVLGVLATKYKWLSGLVSMFKKKVETAKTPEAKKKAIESGIKAVKTVLQKDKEGKYK